MKLSILVVSTFFAQSSYSFITSTTRHSRLITNTYSSSSNKEANDAVDRSYAAEVTTSNSNLKQTILKNAAILASCLTTNVLLGAVSSWAAENDLLETIPEESSSVLGGTFDPMAASKFQSEIEKNRGLNSDEFYVKFENKSLGLGLTEAGYKGFPVVTVSSIKYPLNNVNDKEFRVSLE